MKRRSTEILYNLLDHQGKRLEQLSNQYEISEKMLRNDLKEINWFLKTLQLGAIEINEEGENFLGGEFDAEAIKNELDKMDIYMYKLSPEERRIFIVAKLILQTDYITMEKLAEELYVTRVTIINDLDLLKEDLKKYNVELEAKSKKGIILSYRESDIRILLISLFRKIVKKVKREGYFQRMIISRLQMKYSIAAMVDFLKDFEEQYNLSFTAYVFFELVMVIFVIVNRNQSGFFIESQSGFVQSPREFTTNLMSYIQRKLNIQTNGDEIIALEKYVTENDLLPISKTIDDIEIYKRLMNFLGEIEKAVSVELKKDHMLIESLISHIRSMKDWNPNMRT